MTGDARAGAFVEYVVELVGFPGTKYDDQVDSTIQALDHMLEDDVLATYLKAFGRWCRLQYWRNCAKTPLPSEAAPRQARADAASRRSPVRIPSHDFLRHRIAPHSRGLRRRSRSAASLRPSPRLARRAPIRTNRSLQVRRRGQRDWNPGSQVTNLRAPSAGGRIYSSLRQISVASNSLEV